MELDEELFLTLNRAFSGSKSTIFFSMITRLGDGLVLSLLILPMLYYYRRTIFKTHALPMVCAVALSGLAVTVIKIAVDRPRPEEHFSESGVDIHTPLGTPSDRSFPSGHTQTAFGAATYLSCLFPKGSPLFLLLAALVGLSRVAIGVHFPLDVLVGALFGVSFSIVTFHLVHKRTK